MFRIRSQPPEIFSKELRYNQTDPVRTDINISMVSLKKKNAQEISFNCSRSLNSCSRIELKFGVFWSGKKNRRPRRKTSRIKNDWTNYKLHPLMTAGGRRSCQWVVPASQWHSANARLLAVGVNQPLLLKASNYYIKRRAFLRYDIHTFFFLKRISLPQQQKRLSEICRSLFKTHILDR